MDPHVSVTLSHKKMYTCEKERERDMAKRDPAKESEQFTDDDDGLPELVTDDDGLPELVTDDDGLPELVTDTEDTDSDREDPDSHREDNKLPELGTGNEDHRPNPAPSRARPPARPHRELKPRDARLELKSRARPPARPRRELKLPELPTGKPPPRRRFTKGTVPLPEVTTYRFRPVSPVHPSAPAAVDHF